MRGRSPQGVKKNIFKKYFDEFNTYALMVSPVSPSRVPPAFRSGGGGSVASAPATPMPRRSPAGGDGAGLMVRPGSIARAGGGGAWEAPWTPISAAGVSTTHVPSEWDSPRPRWAVGRRKGAGQGGAAAEPGDGPMHAATRPVTCGGPLPSHVAALDELLTKSWSRAEVEAAQSWGFFRRLLPQLGVPPLQAPAALLLGRCARLQPALLPPLTAELCGALPVLMASPRLDVRQAGLCLLGLLWRSTSAGDSHARTQLLGSSALLASLTARISEGDFDALFAAREIAADARGAVALEKVGALRAVCGALRKLVAAARAAAGEVEGDGVGATDGEEEPGGAAAVGTARAGTGPGKSPAAKSPGKHQLALAGGTRKGKATGSPGMRVPPGLTGRSPSPGKKAAIVSVEGVTEGGEETERAAAGVLVADCLAALTAALPAASAMARRYRVPERLVALLLTCRVEPDPEPEKEEDKAHKDTEQAQQEGDTDKGKDQDGEQQQASAAAGGEAAAAGGSQPGGKAASDSGSEVDITKILNEDSNEEKRDQQKAEAEAKKDGSSGGAQPEAEGSAAAGGEGSKGGDAGKEGEAAEATDEKEEGDSHAKRMSQRRRRQLQLQEALLRCLHTLAACGMGKEPQEAVQRALRDAGAPALERLARVLQEHHTLSGCSSAAYLLWLAVAGDYSSTPATELNVLRSRLAAEAPERPEDRSSSSGFGVVGAVRELLLRHVAVTGGSGGGGGWKDEDLGDAVAEVGTAVLPPPPPPPPAAVMTGTPRGAGSSLRLGGGAGGSSGSGGESDGRLRRSIGPGAGGAVPSLINETLPRPQDLVAWESPFALSGAASSGEAVGGGAAGGDGGGGAGAGREVTRPSLGLPTLRVASAGLLLTPRESRPGSGGHTISPQRYAAGSSDEEDEEGGGRGRRRAAAFGASRNGSGDGDERDGGSSVGGGRGDGDGGGGSASTPPEDLDMSNIIDSSVELTGKEYIMQAIQEAGALAVQEEGGFPGPAGPSPDPRVSGGAGTIAPMPSPGEPFPPVGVPGGVGGAHSPAGRRSVDQQGGYGRDGLPVAPGSGSTPLGAPRSSRTPDSNQQQRHVDWAPDGARLDARRPAALELALAASSPLGGGGAGGAGGGFLAVGRDGRVSSAKRIPLLTLKTRLGALRTVRRQRRSLRPPPAEFQELLQNCFGLLSAIALSASGCRAICEAPRPAAGAGSEGDGIGGILPFAASLLETAADAPESLAAAAVSGSSMELRLQLFALMGNVALHSDGMAALTAEAAGAPPGLVGGLFAAARESLALVGSSSTGWREGQRLLEACFTVLTNLHRGRASLSPPPDPGTGQPQSAYGLALRALAMTLPGAMGAVDRARVRAAAARMLDSAIAAYEGIGGSAPPAVAEELVALVATGAGISTPAIVVTAEGASSASVGTGAGARAFGPGAGREDAEGGGGGAGGPRVTEAAERAACDAAAALWQLMAAGQVHPDAVVSALTPALSAIFRRTDASATLITAALGLTSCLARSPLVARRLWTTPLVPAVMKAHARARKAGVGEVEEAARSVCQQLLRACHREDRGSVSDVDRRVDRWGLTERMLSQLKCRLEWDSGEEAIMLVDWDAD
ncbi:hypothetical protein HYH02_005059 [Chlamydomonas schloesseri]|uniref:Uncharacterized protein n=1 Tax=Chlamydomonas schloesseri TaxID=2026947 RepID=A0A835WNN8_9CHLO|nr:hypothetical protein HYH02_005059 [Chlamydomonas schloesseri]|eukprot:KAG2450558.1 hypothetical protein HYH02_005059 [Chlamydomonas schloesseri]